MGTEPLLLGEKRCQFIMSDFSFDSITFPSVLFLKESVLLKDSIPARRHTLRAHWWERQTWRRGRGSSAAASESCTSPSTETSSHRCSLTAPWQPHSGSSHLWREMKLRGASLFMIGGSFYCISAVPCGRLTDMGKGNCLYQGRSVAQNKLIGTCIWKRRLCFTVSSH